MIGNGLGHRAGIPVGAAIVVELVNGLVVAGVLVTTADVAITAIVIAGDVSPGRRCQSPADGRAGRQTDQLGVAIGRGGGPVPAQIAVVASCQLPVASWEPGTGPV